MKVLLCRNKIYCHSLLILLEFKRTVPGHRSAFSLVFLCFSIFFREMAFYFFIFKIPLCSSFFCVILEILVAFITPLFSINDEKFPSAKNQGHESMTLLSERLYQTNKYVVKVNNKNA